MDLINARELYKIIGDVAYLNVNAILSEDALKFLFSTTPKATIISATALSKNSHTFEDGTKKFLIRSEKVTKIKYNFSEADYDDNKKLTITSGGHLKEENVFLENVSIYFDTDLNADVEILEWS